MLLEATVPDDTQLRWWLKGFGDQVEVIGPKQLRDEFVELAGNIIGMYKPAKATIEDSLLSLAPPGSGGRGNHRDGGGG